MLGALAFIALIALAALFFVRRRRMRASRPAPSAEFMRMARDPAFASLRDDDAGTTSGVPLARQVSLEDDERPPAFTPGNYRDPVYEKVQESAEMRERYDHDSDDGGYGREGYRDH